MSSLERLPIAGPDGAASHLAVRFSAPERRAADTAVLYLHGFGSSQDGEKAEHFRRSALEVGFAFCSFDFQGHGDSGGTLEGLTLSRNLEDTGRVHAFLRQRGFRRVILLGSSMGGASALWYAAIHPQEVAAGLHIAPALGMGEGLERQAGPEGLRRWRETGRRTVDGPLGPSELGWGLIEDLRAHPRERLFELYRTPTLVVQGKRDTSVDWRQVLDFTVRCPFEEIELHLFADGDHRLLDRKERLWELMLEFLRGRGFLPSR